MSQPENQAFIEEALRAPLLHDFMRFRMTACDTRSAVVEVDHRPELGHIPGWFQGSIITAIAEFAGAFAAILSLPGGRATATVDQTIKFIGAARGERLIARGRVLKPSLTLVACQVEVFVLRDGAEHLCAVMLQSNSVLPASA